jgi:hypothetical protein
MGREGDGSGNPTYLMSTVPTMQASFTMKATLLLLERLVLGGRLLFVW